MVEVVVDMTAGRQQNMYRGSEGDERERLRKLGMAIEGEGEGGGGGQTRVERIASLEGM